MNAAANRYGSEINRADMAEHGGIDHHHADGGQLGNKDGECVTDQATRDAAKHGAGLSHMPAIDYPAETTWPQAKPACCGQPEKIAKIQAGRGGHIDSTKANLEPGRDFHHESRNPEKFRLKPYGRARKQRPPPPPPAHRPAPADQRRPVCPCRSGRPLPGEPAWTGWR